MRPPAAVIWDCDGALIDSERIVCTVAMDAFNAAGAAFTFEDYVATFVGRAADAKLETLDLTQACSGTADLALLL